MNLIDSPVEPLAARDTRCAIEAFGVARLPFEELAARRKAVWMFQGSRIPPSLLKHADPQTLLALAALLQAVSDFGWSERSFAEWGVIAAPRFLGRIGVAVTMHRFSQAGASTISPMIVPNMSLHAVAGALSLAIQAHGFNYGVGGGPSHVAEGLLAGLAARDDGGVPGIWVVATGFDPEPVPDTSGNCLTPTTGYAVALALTSAEPASRRWNLRLALGSAAMASRVAQDVESEESLGVEPLTPLIRLADFLTDGIQSPGGWSRRGLWLPHGAGLAVGIDDDPARGVATSTSARAG